MKVYAYIIFHTSSGVQFYALETLKTQELPGALPPGPSPELYP